MDLVNADNEVPLPKSKADKKLAVTMLGEGISSEKVCAIFKVTASTLRGWAKDHPEIAAEIHATVKARALTERGANVEELVRIRDNSENDVARIKAIELLETRAGVMLEYDKQTKAPMIVIQGAGEINLHAASNEDLEKMVRELTALMPERARKFIDAELAGKSLGAAAQRESEPAGGAREDAAGEPGNAGGVVGEGDGGAEAPPSRESA